MSIGERMKAVRRALRLSQTEFGQGIGLSLTWVSRAEAGRRSLTEKTILNICRVYNVNEPWLRTGEGEMFLRDPVEVFAELTAAYNLSDPERDLVAAFLEMAPWQRRDAIYCVLRHVSEQGRSHDLDREEAAAIARVREEFAAKRKAAALG